MGKKVLRIPEQKLQKTVQYIEFCSNADKLSPRQVLKVSGLVCSLAVVLGPTVYMEMKPLFWEIEGKGKSSSRYTWDRKFRLSDHAKAALNTLWMLVNTNSAERLLSEHKAMVIIYSDVSAIRGAAFITGETEVIASNWFVSNMHGTLKWLKMARLPASECIAVQKWSHDEAKQSSTWRELKVIQES